MKKSSGLLKETATAPFVSSIWTKALRFLKKHVTTYLTEYMKEAKYKTLTPEPVVAYILAKEAEAKCVRNILTCKLHNIDTEIIKERVREVYV
ncbi:MAG: V-type ATPase subunit [Anaerotignum sp.]